jgi:hypothetical protein
MAIGTSNPFSNLFNIETQDIKKLIIKENSAKDNCFIQEGSTLYGGFILIDKPAVKTICKVNFRKSKDNKYLPRLEFRKEDKAGNVKQSKGNDVIVNFGEGNDARNFWKLVHFLQGFKDLVDMGDFHSKYQAISFESYFIEFQNKGDAERIDELISFSEKTKLSNQEIKKLLFPQRRNTIHWFYAFLKDLSKNSKRAFDTYREKHKIVENGEEPIWHHFLKTNEWIIGLNVDVKFIRDLFSEQKVGKEDTKGKGSPKVDLLGISYFTTLIELKTSKTLVFKKEKSKSRANTWDFSSDFIEAYSQTLAQRTELNDGKNIIDNAGNIMDTQKHRILDPKSVLIIGNRNSEFPHVRQTELNTKSDTFERFRRDNRNVEIITFDELFERAFHIVYSEKLPVDWHSMETSKFKKDILKVL